MANEKDLALLSLYAYRASDKNTVIPSGWVAIRDRTEGIAGFAYAVFRNLITNEVVIAYRGTDGIADWLTNLGLIFAQEFQAALVYVDVLRTVPRFRTVQFPRNSA